MTRQNIRLPADWRRFDRTGLWGAVLFPLLLAGLWAIGLGPNTYQECDLGTKPPSVHLASDGRKILLSGRVASAADQRLLVDAAKSIYGAANVTDQLVPDNSVHRLVLAGSVPGFLKSLKDTGQPLTLKLDGKSAVIEGEFADKAARDETARITSGFLGNEYKLKDQLTFRPPPPAPPPVVKAPEPPPAPATIAAGTIGRRKLPDGTEISIMGDGLESKVLDFLDAKDRAIDSRLWFDFDRLHFRTGSSDLTAESKAQIDTVVAIMKAYPAAAIKIGGYTDNVGDQDANLKLSATRAERVAKELTGLGVAADRIEFEGYGEQHPVADNATPEGRARNRRTALSVRRK